LRRPEGAALEQAAEDALGQEDDEQHQQHAVDQVVPADRLGAERDAQRLGQQDGDDRADGRAERDIDAADHGGEHHLQRHAMPLTVSGEMNIWYWQ
jgi:hypothetical protein